MRIEGLSAFPVTPASPDGRVDTGALAALVGRLVAAKVDSVGLLGSTGSYPYFTRAERRRAVAAAAETLGDGGPALLVGIGALRTDDAVELARDALAAGADAGLLAPVSYAPLVDAEVFEHVRAVAATGLPICIYNNPSTTHFNVSTALAGRLAGIPGVVAIKNPAPAPAESASMLAALREAVPPGFSVGVSVDWNAPAALLAGADAWYSVLGGTCPATCLRLLGAARAGNAAEVARLCALLDPVWRVFRAYGSYRVVHLLAGTAPPRPVLPLDGDAAREVLEVFERLTLD